MLLSHAIQLYFSHYASRYSKTTLTNYRPIFRIFQETIGDKDTAHITMYDIDVFAIRLQQIRQINAVYLALVAIRSLAYFCDKNGIPFVKGDRIDLPRKKKIVRIIPTIEEIFTLIDSIGNDALGIRNKAILTLLFFSACRVGEIANLKIQDLDMKRREIKVLGKGNKERICDFTEIAKFYLSRWLEIRDYYAADDGLFVAISGRSREQRKRLTPIAIAKILKSVRSKLNISKKITCHTLRHFRATDLYNNGMDIKSLSEYLGHESIATTQIYVHTTRKHIKEQYHRASQHYFPSKEPMWYNATTDSR